MFIFKKEAGEKEKCKKNIYKMLRLRNLCKITLYRCFHTVVNIFYIEGNKTYKIKIFNNLYFYISAIKKIKHIADH